jgi:hypothetical protein
MFQKLTLHGGAASLVLGYSTAVVLRSWRIAKDDTGRWVLTGSIGRVDAFLSRQKPLLFTAPRDGGFWAWGVESIELGPTSLRAYLGPPER